MHVADVDASVVDSRVGAMHTVNPFHTFMFDSDGVLLNANVKALEAFARHTTGEHAPCCLLPEQQTLSYCSPEVVACAGHSVLLLHLQLVLCCHDPATDAALAYSDSAGMQSQ